MRPSSRSAPKQQLWGYGGSSRHAENLSDGEEDFAGQDAQRVGYSAAEDHQRLLAQLQRSGAVRTRHARGAERLIQASAVLAMLCALCP